MKNEFRIGKLKNVPIRSVFPHEAHDFTVWLASNLDVLSSRIGIQLALERSELVIEGIRADIVCHDSHGNRVIIENQLEQTNDDHFVRLVRYMGKLRANTAIWITPEPTPKHQELIQILNSQSKPGYGYYLVKVEMICIDNSNPYPLFTVLMRTGEHGGVAEEIFEAGTEIQIAESDSPIAINLPPVWCVYPRHDEETYKFFLTKNFIGLGFGDMGDLRELPPTREAFKDRWARSRPEQSDAQIRAFYPMFFSLIHRVAKGDLVIYPPTWLEETIYVGRITGNYQYLARQPQDYFDVRAVEWLTSFPRDSFSPAALKGITVNLAFFQVRNETFLAELGSRLM